MTLEACSLIAKPNLRHFIPVDSLKLRERRRRRSIVQPSCRQNEAKSAPALQLKLQSRYPRHSPTSGYQPAILVANSPRPANTPTVKQFQAPFICRIVNSAA